MASGNSEESGETFEEFYSDLKKTEAADSKLTPKEQIDRLLRPGHTYRNLNPFEVLQVDPETAIEDVKKKYRRLSILVHPDKNSDDRERAQQAFDALRKASSMLEDEKSREKCYEVVEEAKGRTEKELEEKRKLRRKEAAAKGLPLTPDNLKIEEDDPEKCKQAVQVLTMKLFADMERKRRQLEDLASAEALKKREGELKVEERRNMEKEFNKNWEETRQGRVNSWLNFTGKVGQVGTQVAEEEASNRKKKVKEKKDKRFSPMGFRPPKHKPESR